MPMDASVSATAMTTSYLRPLSVIAFLILVMAGLIGVAERAGLPLGLVRLSLSVMAAMAVLAIIAFAGTGREKDFAGFTLASPPVGSGVLLALIAGVIVEMAWPASSSAEWGAGPLGAAAGVILAHLIERYGVRRESWQPGESGSAQRAERLMRGLAFGLLGAGLALVAFPVLAAELVQLFRLSPQAATAVAAAIPLIAVLAGGMRSALSLAFAASAMVIATLAVLVGAGLWTIGNLPLPGQAEPATLLAVAEVRRNWSVVQPMHLMEWPGWSAVFSGTALQHFGLGCLIATGLTLALAPSLQVRRRSFVGAAMVVSLIMPLLIVSIGGFAIEAAAVKFIGVPIVRPPASLIEASQLGLLSICGAQPADAEALRIACGVGPRDAAVFDWRQIALSPAFTHAGLGTALGFPPSLALATAGLRLFLGLAAATAGLMLFSLGLGFYLLSRNRIAAGLASIRLGATRLVATVAAILLVVFSAELRSLDPAIIPGLIGAGAVLQIVSTAFRTRNIRSAEVMAEVPAPKPLRRRKASAEGELA